jgi:hypothetical protein
MNVCNKLVFVPGRLFKPNPMFASELCNNSLWSLFTNVCNKLQCLSLVGLSSLVQYLRANYVRTLFTVANYECL